MDKQYAGTSAVYGGETASQLAPKQPPLGCLYEAVQRLGDAAQFCRATADRLCGGQPEAIGKDSSPTVNSYFGELEQLGAEVRTLASRIDVDMQRIQSRL